MTERERIQKALSPLHASDGTIEEVLKMAEFGKKKTPSARRSILIAAVIVALLAVTAFAIGKGGLFLKWFGGSENLTDAQEELISKRTGTTELSASANGVTVTAKEVFAGNSIVKVILHVDGVTLAEKDAIDFAFSCQSGNGESVPVHAQSMEPIVYEGQNVYMVTWIAAPDSGRNLLSGDYHLSIHLNALSTDTGAVQGPWDLDVPVPSLEKETCLYLESAALSSGAELFDISLTATELQFSALGKPDVKSYEPIAILSDGTQVGCSFITYSEDEADHTTCYRCYYDQPVDVTMLQSIQICGNEIHFSK